MMHPLLGTLALALPLLAAATAQAQPRDFKCIGAERLEDDVFEVPFPARSARPGPAARNPVAAAAALAAADLSRNICVLGHSVREGGQSTGTQLAARRAREVSEMLAVGHGIERDRIRAEARNPGFSRRTENREARSVTIVVLPSQGPAQPPPPAERTAPTPPAATPPAATPPAATPPAAAPRAAPPASVPPSPPAQAPAPAAPPATTPPSPPAAAPAPAAPPAATPPAQAPAPGGDATDKPASP